MTPQCNEEKIWTYKNWEYTSFLNACSLDKTKIQKRLLGFFQQFHYMSTRAFDLKQKEHLHCTFTLKNWSSFCYMSAKCAFIKFDH